MSVKKVSDFGSVPHFSPSLRDAGRRFISSYKAAGYSKSYVQSLEETIGYLAHYSEEHGWPSVAHITTEHLEEYFAYSRTRKKGYGERTVNGSETLSSGYLDRQFRQLHCFWNWLADGKRRLAPENVLDAMKRPRVEQKVVPIVSDEEICNLLSLVDPKLARTLLDTFRLLRNGAVICIFVDTPGRRQEIATMKIGDLFLEDKKDERIQVMGKGRRQRFMPIGKATGRMLEDYLEARDKLFPSTRALWVSEKGEPMQNDWLYQMIKRLGKRANVPALHPHMFRHTFAINALREGMQEEHLKILGGWRKIPQTYFQTLGYEDAAAFYRAMSLGDRLLQQSTSRKRSRPGRGDGRKPRGRL